MSHTSNCNDSFIATSLNYHSSGPQSLDNLIILRLCSLRYITLSVVNHFGSHLPKTAFPDGPQNFKVVKVDCKTNKKKKNVRDY